MNIMFMTDSISNLEKKFELKYESTPRKSRDNVSNLQ